MVSFEGLSSDQALPVSVYDGMDLSAFSFSWHLDGLVAVGHWQWQRRCLTLPRRQCLPSSRYPASEFGSWICLYDASFECFKLNVCIVILAQHLCPASPVVLGRNGMLSTWPSWVARYPSVAEPAPRGTLVGAGTL